jgi:protein-tyrosine kinase
MRIRSSAGQGGPIEPSSRSRESGRLPIGQIMNIDDANADAVVARQGETGRLFGETAVELGMATDGQVQRAIEEQQGFFLLAEGDARINPLVVAAFHPGDPVALAARDLRGAIVNAKRPDGSPVRSVALLGVESSATTSIIASNLAVVCTQAGFRTLLVDANLSDPHQHELFRVANRNGVATALSRSERVNDVAQPTALPLLSIVTAGPAVPNASELFERKRFANAVDHLADDFDLLIADIAGGDRQGGGAGAAFGLDAAILILQRNVSGMGPLQAVSRALREHDTIVLGAMIVD